MVKHLKKKSVGKKKNPPKKVFKDNSSLNKVLVENFVDFQKVMVNLTEKFDDLAVQISKLLELFELSAKHLAKKDFELNKEKNDSVKILEKLDLISHQTSLIGKGLALIHESGYSAKENDERDYKEDVPRSPLKNQRNIPQKIDMSEDFPIRTPNESSMDDIVRGSLGNKMAVQIMDKTSGLILLEFTKSILRNTDSYRTSFIQEGVKEILSYHDLIDELKEKIHKEEGKKIREIVVERIKEDSKIISNLKKEAESFEGELFRSEFDPEDYRIHPSLPDFPLQKTIGLIKSIPLSEKIDLGRLNKILNDSFVKMIECDGPDKKLIISDLTGRKPSYLSLTKEEIDDIINAFSCLGRIPVKPGAFKVVFGNLVISALISEIIGSRFSIKKLH